MKKLTRHELSISVATVIDPFSLFVLDGSVYREDGADTPLLEILAPDATESVTVPFNPGNQNLITSYDFGATMRSELKDGLYKLTYSVAPNCYVYTCLNYFRTDQLRCRFMLWMETINWSMEEPCSATYQKLFRIHALILGIEANTRAGEVQLAQEQYNLAHSLLCTQELKSMH